VVAYAFTALGLIVPLHGTPAEASPPTKVWVASWGTDGPSCGAATAPCATFQQAHDNVAAGGEIAVLTPGDYGGTKIPRLAITKAVSIAHSGPGDVGILRGADGPAVSIRAGADDVVSLRGLVIDGQGVASDGIQVWRAAAVRIQNCVIKNFEGEGSGLGISLVSGFKTELLVSDTGIFNNGGSASTGGISIRPFGRAANVNVVLDRVRLENNIIGLKVDATGSTGRGIHVTIRDSVVAGNGADGIFVTSAPGKAPALINVEGTVSVNNAGNGILADGPGVTVLMRSSLVAQNETAISTTNGGQLISYQQQPGQRFQHRILVPLMRSVRDWHGEQ